MASPLAEAYPSVEALERLLDEGESPDAEVGPHGARLVHLAVVDGKTEVLRLVSSRGGNLDCLDAHGKSALNLCLEKKRLKMLELLLDLGADPNNATVRSESTLHQAAILADQKYLELLVEKGATCEKEDKLGDWPIHKACLEENLKCVEFLVHKFPQQINQKGNRDLTAMHIAANDSNVELFTVLAQHGADICAEDSRGMTPVDVIIVKQDTYIIDTYAYLLARKVLAAEGASDYISVLNTKAGQEFLDSLILMDNEFRSQAVTTRHEIEYCTNTLDTETNEQLLGYIESDEKIDINEFVQIVVKAVKNGLVDEIIARNLVPKISDSVFKHVLMPQNEKLLRELMRLGLLWGRVVKQLEGSYIEMYEKSLIKKKVGIRGLVWRNCAESDEEEEVPAEESSSVSNEKLHTLLATITKLGQLQHSDTISEENNSCSYFSTNETMKDPVQTVAMWSVLTGRFKVTPHLLRQEPFDLIPQALLTAMTLRALSKRRDIEDVYSLKAEKMAATCEGIAIQALRSVKDKDTSQNNILTMEFLRIPLASYGEYSIIDLAARGESSNFVTIDVVQDALDMYWYSDFFFIRSSWKMEAAIILAFSPLLPLIPRVMEHIRKVSPSFKRPDQAPDAKLTQVKDMLDHHRKQHNEACGDGDEDDIPEPEVKPTRKRPFLKELSDFYQMPCVKFRLHVAAHVAFVLLLSLIVMKNFGNSIGKWEIVCYLCLLGFFVEELNEIIQCKQEESLGSYFSDGWNLIDLTAIFCGLLSFFIRLEHRSVESDDGILYWSLVLLSTTCLVYWIRLLFASVILESLGPKLKMMALMVRQDFMPFLYILFILMIGFGVIFQALLYPPYDPRYDVQSGSDIITRMFRTTFYIIVGDYSIETNPCTSMTDNSTDCVHEMGARLVPNVFMVTYIVIMQILLLNVIVAMFSKTIDAINNESKAMWQFEKYDLIQEFFKRATLPPPFNTLLEIRKLILWVLRKLRKQMTQAAQAAGATEEDSEHLSIYIYFLYYQAISCRNNRATFNGVVIDEEDLDEGNKIIHSEIKAIQKELKRLRKLESAVQALAGKGRGRLRAADS